MSRVFQTSERGSAKNNNSSGDNGLHNQIYKLVIEVCENEIIPTEQSTAVIQPLFKKGDVARIIEYQVGHRTNIDFEGDLNNLL